MKKTSPHFSFAVPLLSRVALLLVSQLAFTQEAFTSAPEEDTHKNMRYTALSNAIKEDKAVDVVFSNDNHTDPDSQRSVTDFIAHTYKSASEAKRTSPVNITLYVDDEYTKEDVLRIAANPAAYSGIKAIQEHYLAYKSAIETSEPKHGYRTMDTAMVSLSLVKYLDPMGQFIKVSVVQGARTCQDPERAKKVYRNIYLGTFGVAYTSEKEMAVLSEIHPETGPEALIEILRERKESGSKLFFLNGGSMQMNRDLCEFAPDLVEGSPNLMMVGNIEIPGDVRFARNAKSTDGSWNEKIARGASLDFFGYMANPKGSRFSLIFGVDVATVEYGSPECDGKVLPEYSEFLKDQGYHLFTTPAAIKSLESVARLHTIFSRNRPPKFMDSQVSLFALGLLGMPMDIGPWKLECFQFIKADSRDPGAINIAFPSNGPKHPFYYPLGQEASYPKEVAKMNAYKGEIKGLLEGTREIVLSKLKPLH